MIINNEQELEARIHGFIERKTKRFPDIAKLEAEQDRSGILTKLQTNMADWFHATPRVSH